MERLDNQLTRLTTMSSAALRAEWRQLYKRTAPDLTADLLRRGIAWRLQEKALGGLSPARQREIERLVREVARTGEALARPATRIKPGTLLVRDWGGDSHHVLVLDEGFLYREQRYSSLTTIAHSITGARWPGPHFFGLKAKASTDA